MVLRTAVAYSALKKKDKDGKFRSFFPLRAVGLALESGYKLCQQKGFWSVQAEDLSNVRVAGDLQVLEAGSWKRTGEATLQLRSQDASFALKLLAKQREFLSDLDFNWFCTDTRVGDKSLDLVGDFSTKRNLGVPGKVWVEVKAFGKVRFKKQVEKERKTLRTDFSSLKRKDSRFGAVLLLAAECEALGDNWGQPVLRPELLKAEGGDWESLSSKRKAARGQAQSKPAFSTLWTRLEKHTTAAGEKVCLHKHFLAELGVPTSNTPDRMRTHNKLLRLAGRGERLAQKKVLEKSGKAPVVGSKQVFRELYKLP